MKQAAALGMRPKALHRREQAAPRQLSSCDRDNHTKAILAVEEASSK